MVSALQADFAQRIDAHGGSLQRRTANAVSYTHLDVYKRQTLACGSVICQDDPDDSALAECEALGKALQ